MGAGYLCPFMAPGQVLCVHIALQELQAVALKLHQMAFHLDGKVIALHLDNSTAKAYLCNQCDTVCPLLPPHIAYTAFWLWGQQEVVLLASSQTNQCNLYYSEEHPLLPGALGLNAFNHSW